jgi:hypothetical protein
MASWPKRAANPKAEKPRTVESISRVFLEDGEDEKDSVLCWVSKFGNLGVFPTRLRNAVSIKEPSFPLIPDPLSYLS